MDKDTKSFAVVCAIVGILLTLVMLYYANKSDRLIDDYAKGTLTLNLEKTGWAQGRDKNGNITYKQENQSELAKSECPDHPGNTYNAEYCASCAKRQGCPAW
jgi:hypothetical protein